MRAAAARASELRPSVNNSEGRLSYHKTGIAPTEGRREEPGLGRARRGIGAVVTAETVAPFAFDAGSGKGLEVSFVQQRELLRARPLQQVPRDHPVRRLRGDPRV